MSLIAAFARNVQFHREAAGLSQQQLADAIGVRKERVVEIEERRFTPTLQSIQKLAKALGCEVADLVRDDGSA